MKSIKNCPYCGNDFEGRNNKVYCSDKCKIAAFRQIHEESSLEEEEDIFVSSNEVPETERLPFQDNSINHQLELQIELRKLELEHIRTLADIQSTERDKERSFELEKIKLAFEKEKGELWEKINGLQKQKTSIPISVEEEVEIEEDEETYIVLPTDLKSEYNELVKIFLNAEEQECNLSQIGSYKAKVKAFGKKMVSYAKINGFDKSDINEYYHLKAIVEALKEMIVEIENKSFFAAKVTTYKLSQEWREELEDSLED